MSKNGRPTARKPATKYTKRQLLLPKGKVKAHTATKKCKPNLVSFPTGLSHEVLLCRPIPTISHGRACLIGQMGV
jgi:hypothetical protein